MSSSESNESGSLYKQHKFTFYVRAMCHFQCLRVLSCQGEHFIRLHEMLGIKELPQIPFHDCDNNEVGHCISEQE